MASIRNHVVTERWKTRLDPKHVFCFTKADRVLQVGLKGGNAKILHINEHGTLNFSGQGRRGTVADFKMKFNDMAGWEKLS